MSSIWNINTDLKAGALVRVLSEYHIDDQAAIWLVYPKSNVLTDKVRVSIDFLNVFKGHLKRLIRYSFYSC